MVKSLYNIEEKSENSLQLSPVVGFLSSCVISGEEEEFKQLLSSSNLTIETSFDLKNRRKERMEETDRQDDNIQVLIGDYLKNNATPVTETESMDVVEISFGTIEGLTEKEESKCVKKITLPNDEQEDTVPSEQPEKADEPLYLQKNESTEKSDHLNDEILIDDDASKTQTLPNDEQKDTTSSEYQEKVYDALFLQEEVSTVNDLKNLVDDLLEENLHVDSSSKNSLESLRTSPNQTADGFKNLNESVSPFESDCSPTPVEVHLSTIQESLDESTEQQEDDIYERVTLNFDLENSSTGPDVVEVDFIDSKDLPDISGYTPLNLSDLITGDTDEEEDTSEKLYSVFIERLFSSRDHRVEVTEGPQLLEREKEVFYTNSIAVEAINEQFEVDGCFGEKECVKEPEDFLDEGLVAVKLNSKMVEEKEPRQESPKLVERIVIPIGNGMEMIEAEERPVLDERLLKYESNPIEKYVFSFFKQSMRREEKNTVNVLIDEESEQEKEGKFERLSSYLDEKEKNTFKDIEQIFENNIDINEMLFDAVFEMKADRNDENELKEYIEKMQIFSKQLESKQSMTDEDVDETNTDEVFDFVKGPTINAEFDEDSSSRYPEKAMDGEVFDESSPWDTDYSLGYISSTIEKINEVTNAEDLALKIEEPIENLEQVDVKEAPTIYGIVVNSVSKLLKSKQSRPDELVEDDVEANEDKVFDFVIGPAIGVQLNDDSCLKYPENTMDGEVFDESSHWDKDYSLGYISSTIEKNKEIIDSENLVLKLEEPVENLEEVDVKEVPTIYGIIWSSITSLASSYKFNSKSADEIIHTDESLTVFDFYTLKETSPTKESNHQESTIFLEQIPQVELFDECSPWDTQYSSGFASAITDHLKDEATVENSCLEISAVDDSSEINHLPEGPTIFQSIGDALSNLFPKSKEDQKISEIYCDEVYGFYRPTEILQAHEELSFNDLKVYTVAKFESAEVFDAHSAWDIEYSNGYISSTTERLEQEFKHENQTLQSAYEYHLNRNEFVQFNPIAPSLYRSIWNKLTALNKETNNKQSELSLAEVFDIYQPWDTAYSLGYSSIDSFDQQQPEETNLTSVKEPSEITESIFDAVFDIYKPWDTKYSLGSSDLFRTEDLIKIKPLFDDFATFPTQYIENSRYYLLCHSDRFKSSDLNNVVATATPSSFLSSLIGLALISAGALSVLSFTFKSP